MVVEALDEIACEMEEGSGCMDEDEVEEASGSGAAMGYQIPFGMRPPGPRRDVVNVAKRSFGGIGKKKKRNR